MRFTTAGRRLLKLADEVLPRVHSAEQDVDPLLRDQAPHEQEPHAQKGRIKVYPNPDLRVELKLPCDRDELNRVELKGGLLLVSHLHRLSQRDERPWIERIGIVDPIIDRKLLRDRTLI